MPGCWQKRWLEVDSSPTNPLSMIMAVWLDLAAMAISAVILQFPAASAAGRTFRRHLFGPKDEDVKSDDDDPQWPIKPNFARHFSRSMRKTNRIAHKVGSKCLSLWINNVRSKFSAQHVTHGVQHVTMSSKPVPHSQCNAVYKNMSPHRQHAHTHYIHG